MLVGVFVDPGNVLDGETAAVDVSKGIEVEV